jgi:uncharacterized protein (DUF305 family)
VPTVLRARRIYVVVAGVVVVTVVGVVAALALGGGDDDGQGSERARTVQPGAPGEESRELDEDEAADVGAPSYTQADTTFMQDMVVHHRQALEMAALVAERTGRDDLPLMAERITLSQEAEIEVLAGWLGDRDEEVPEDGADDHADHADMPGMATPEQLDVLAATGGADFDRMFLELMIAHHQGALTMVQDLYAAGGGLEPQADRVARDIDADQSIEIGRMQELLDAL